ncbi:MAG: hypothetical protein IH986_15345 [Planctomycetes bacterium]|nr:hypothetical protein [Planctomycetota bacterium]
MSDLFDCALEWTLQDPINGKCRTIARNLMLWVFRHTLWIQPDWMMTRVAWYLIEMGMPTCDYTTKVWRERRFGTAP